MVWQIEFEEDARRALRKLHPTIVGRVLRFLNERLAVETDPRRLGEAKVVISVVDIGHRSAVYR